ncbi:signal peptidase I [Leuconostoc litchii]|uniref:Signal peptidase I n=1 Tax=Leuconostoc litchii TaxID=1981069 RepID=A0A6P2CMT3_9LACO|nr:signal peptidase I [Leuconostoc litchii]TYC46894.1 signal peptidase I [Leuconostoc litchii]GMA68798.1 signal peptidase I [Leuconostoc litchii]
MKFFKEWVVPIASTMIIVVLIRSFLFTFVTVSGPSMQPNLQDKEKVILNKIATYRRGDVIVFNAKNEDPRYRAGDDKYVKRIIGLPGDTVEYKSSNLYVNGKKVNQSFISLSERSQGTEMSFGNTWTLKTLSSGTLWQKKDRNHTTVPKGTYFVMGDHRSVSNDGRYFGFIDKNHVIGKVVVPFWNSDSTAKKNVNQGSNNFFSK